MKVWKEIAGILLGNALIAFGVAAFILPHEMIVGGVTGLSLILGHYFRIGMDLAVWGLNIGLFLLGLLFLGKKFALTAVLSTAVFPGFLTLFRAMEALTSLTSDRLLSAVYAGILIGIGIGIVLRLGGSTGGMDIPPLILQKKAGIPVAVSMYVFDFVILLLQALFSDGERILYGILTVLLTSVVLNYVILSGQKKIQVLIISDQYEQIREALLMRIDAGATLLHVETGYEKKEQMAVLCVIGSRKLYVLKEAVQEIDEKAFISIAQVNEVRGRGFSLER